jgi:mono/diheme cytochrome c family protein
MRVGRCIEGFYALAGLWLALAPPLRAQTAAGAEHSEIRWSKVSVQLPMSVTQFPAGEGADIANSQCLICHSAGMVLRQPAQTPAQWQATINKMRVVYGAPLPADEVEALAGYLSNLSLDGTAATLARMNLAEEPRTGSAAQDGAEVFAAHCAACHQVDGTGIPGAFPPLAGSNWVNGRDATVVQIVLRGVQGALTVNGVEYNGAMPEFGSQLSDARIAAVLSYVRGQWGNKGGPVGAALVRTQRAATLTRSAPWNGEADLAKMH